MFNWTLFFICLGNVLYVAFWVWVIWSAPVIDIADDEYLIDDCPCKYHLGCPFSGVCDNEKGGNKC